VRFFSNLTFPDKVLFSLLTAGAVVEDLAEDLYENFGVRPTLRRFYLGDDLYFKRKKRFFGNIVSKFMRDQLVVAEGKRGKRSLKLSARGLDNLFARFPKLKFIGRPWDGYWRVVVYDIAEEKKQLRVKLRKGLKKLGYKFIQKSVWISPFSSENDLEVFLKKEKLWGRILVFKTRLASDETQRLANRCWHHGRFSNPVLPKANVVANLFSDSFLPKGL